MDLIKTGIIFAIIFLECSLISCVTGNCYKDIMGSLKLTKYNRLDSPSFKHGPVDVFAGFYIESMDGLQASEMVNASLISYNSYKQQLTMRRQNASINVAPGSKLQSLGLDIYLRMSWTDGRLQHDDDDLCMINSIEALKGLWIPDLYVANAKNALFHNVLVPNFILHISRNGTVSYSARVTLTTACNMDLVYYPLDHQMCSVRLLSYGYTRDQLNVKWFTLEPLATNPEINLPEMYNLNISSGYCDGMHKFAVTEYGYKQGNFSCLEARIRMKRAIGYHLVQTYIPTGLIVMISWVSFWIDVNAVPARVSLSFTTLLTLATQGAGLRIALPPVAYAKAVDYWFGMCMVFVFAALLEFAAVNNMMRRSKKLLHLSLSSNIPINSNNSYPDVENALVFSPSFPLNHVTSRRVKSQSDAVARRALVVDKVCRLIFPAAFAIFNLIYWTFYINSSKHHSIMRDKTIL